VLLFFQQLDQLGQLFRQRLSGNVIELPTQRIADAKLTDHFWIRSGGLPPLA
jgi:hypothetical protein